MRKAKSLKPKDEEIKYMKYKLKVCGMKYADNIREVAALRPDYMGFIFYEGSKRFVGNMLDEDLLNSLKDIKKVGVFVNESFENIVNLQAKYGFDFIQLHGDESPEFCLGLDAFGLPVIKAFNVDHDFDFSKLKGYKDHNCAYFLFDARTEQYGGSGKKFNWKLLEKYDNELPFFLSGGITPEDFEEINKLKGLNVHAIDINSRFETAPGIKDVVKIKNFMESLN
jgi:phosphoribosylanthranilate isomerase